MTRRKKQKGPKQSVVRLTKERQHTHQDIGVAPSDRMSLVNAANMLVGSMVHRQVAPLMEGGVAMADHTELSSEERTCYNAAMEYLKRQFATGHTDGGTFVAGQTNEVDREFEHKAV